MQNGPPRPLQRRVAPVSGGGIGAAVAAALAAAGTSAGVNRPSGPTDAVRTSDRQGRDPGRSDAAGKIVCMGSVHEVVPWAGHANHAASKGGGMPMMQSLAQVVAPRGIRVNGVAPGAVQTEIDRAARQTPEAPRRLLTPVPHGRIGRPGDVAEAAVWLASDRSDHGTGTAPFVDGGMSLYPGLLEDG